MREPAADAGAADAGAAAERWASELARWAIPTEILAQAPKSPWTFPTALFAAPDIPADSPSRDAALAALPDGGRVLDVGAGGGAASLALVPPAGSITAVDASADMLATFSATAGARGISHRTVCGTWPEVADEVEPADVVVCHHVLYNVASLVPFIRALTEGAARRVVCELTAIHPQAALNDLWRHFWDIERPTGPTADDAIEVLRSLGIRPEVARWERPPRRTDHHRQADEVAFVRRRLCLSPDRDPEIDALLPQRATTPPSEMVTLWWDGAAG